SLPRLPSRITLFTDPAMSLSSLSGHTSQTPHSTHRGLKVVHTVYVRDLFFARRKAMLKPIETPKAPKPFSNYSQAMEVSPGPRPHEPEPPEFGGVSGGRGARRGRNA